MARMNFIAISDFLRGSAELDCPKVELKRSRQEEHAKTIEGPGSISLDSDGTFQLKVYLLQLLDFEEIFEHLKGTSKNQEFHSYRSLQKNALRRQRV
jgi:hypothetical protein